MVQTPICWKVDIGNFFDFLEYSANAPDLLIPSHLGPSLGQLDTLDVFHDDVFAANRGQSIIAPVKDSWNRDTSIGLDCIEDLAVISLSSLDSL